MEWLYEMERKSPASDVASWTAAIKACEKGNAWEKVFGLLE